MQTYETDVVTWAEEQVRLLRAGRFDLLDIEHIVEEIEGVGKSEQRELANRMALLLAHLLKWQYQPSRQTVSWQRTIIEQRKGIKKRLSKSPGLQPMLADADWQSEIWADAVALAATETGLADFPEVCLWSWLDEVLTDGWLPASPNVQH
ncbi:MAG: hypothetical protein RLZZ226_251 [Pseudomonadota bacterium]|jgi:hypothetical protein